MHFSYAYSDLRLDSHAHATTLYHIVMAGPDRNQQLHGTRSLESVSAATDAPPRTDNPVLHAVELVWRYVAEASGRVRWVAQNEALVWWRDQPIAYERDSSRTHDHMCGLASGACTRLNRCEARAQVHTRTQREYVRGRQRKAGSID